MNQQLCSNMVGSGKRKSIIEVGLGFTLWHMKQLQSSFNGFIFCGIHSLSPDPPNKQAFPFLNLLNPKSD